MTDVPSHTPPGRGMLVGPDEVLAAKMKVRLLRQRGQEPTLALMAIAEAKPDAGVDVEQNRGESDLANNLPSAPRVVAASTKEEAKRAVMQSLDAVFSKPTSGQGGLSWREQREAIVETLVTQFEEIVQEANAPSIYRSMVEDKETEHAYIARWAEKLRQERGVDSDSAFSEEDARSGIETDT